MSFEYRKQKRLLAHRVLEILVNHYYLKTATISTEAHTVQYLTVSLKELCEKYNLKSIPTYRAVKLLMDNDHINYTTLQGDFPSTTLRLNDNGEDAYYSGFYFVANRKDKLEDVEILTKWIMPVISLCIAVLALIISAFNGCNKKPDEIKILPQTILLQKDTSKTEKIIGQSNVDTSHAKK